MPLLGNLTSRQKMIIMLAVMSGLFVVALDQTIVATALGAIVSDFNSYTSLGLVVTSYLLFLTVTMPIAGKLSDIFGRRLLLLVGVSVFTIGSLLSGISNSIEQLIAFRALQGIGGGIVMANAFTIIGDLFVPRERAKWQGIIGAVFGLSSVVGPLLGGFLTDPHTFLSITTNWRWNFFINIPVGVFAVTMIALYCPKLTQKSRQKVDYAGAVLLVVALAALIAAVDNTDVLFAWITDMGVSLDLVRVALYLITALATAAFIWRESHASSPIIPLSFFRNRTYVASMVSFIFFGAGFLAVILYITQFNQQVFGASAMKSGLMLLPLIIGMSVMSGAIGQLVQRTGKYKLYVLAGFAMAALGSFGLMLLDETSPYWLQAAMTALAGIGFGTGMPILNLAVQNEFTDAQLGAATSSSQLFRGLGSTLGTAALTGILTLGITTTLGDSSKTAYIQSLRRVPEAHAMIGDGPIDTDTALQINSQRVSIKQQATAGIDHSGLPPQQKAIQKSAFAAAQSSYTQQVSHAFASSLRTVFLVTGSLMAVAFIAALFIREKSLGK